MDMNMTMTNTTMYMTMQTSFKWGRDVTVLFANWPGDDQHNAGMYILALFFVFALAFAVEGLSVWPTIKPSSSPVARLSQASLYAIRICLGYFVMLAVMSFNIGVFIAAVAGHTVGFLVAKASGPTTKTAEAEPSF